MVTPRGNGAGLLSQHWEVKGVTLPLIKGSCDHSIKTESERESVGEEKRRFQVDEHRLCPTLWVR